MTTLCLSDCSLNQRVYITDMSLRQDLHKRLQELGFIPGTCVVPLFRSPFGDPTAYGVMGSILALRKTDAKGIFVSPEKEDIS